MVIVPNLQNASLLWPEIINNLEKHITTHKGKEGPLLAGNEGFSKGKDVHVLGMEVDDATSKQVVIDVLANDVNAPKVRDEVFP